MKPKTTKETELESTPVPDPAPKASLRHSIVATIISPDDQQSVIKSSQGPGSLLPQETATPAVRFAIPNETGTKGTAASTARAGGAFSGAAASRAPARQQGASSSFTGGGKRLSDGDGKDEQDSSKRPRGDGQGGQGQGGSQQAIATASRPLSPCEIAAAFFARYPNANANSQGIQGPVTIPGITNGFVEDSTVFRAVAAVSEAISTSGRGVQFSLIENAALGALNPGFGMTPEVTRPGNEVLMPWNAPPGGHLSLYVVRRVGTSNNFTIGHFDSTDQLHHRESSARSKAGNGIRDLLNQTGWNELGLNTIVTGTPVSVNATRQNSRWECGIHTTLSAWAYALGLQLADAKQPPGQRYGNFLKQAADLINLALAGRVDSDTIRAFLECFAFIRPGQTVAPERSFTNTVPLRTDFDYTRHNNQVQEQLALDQVLGESAATAAAEDAARQTAAEAEAAADAEQAAQAAMQATSTGQNGGRATSVPPPDSQQVNNNASPNTGNTNGGSSQPGTVSQPASPTSNDGATSGDRPSRSPTPGSISGAESDSNDGFFGGEPEGPPSVGEAPQSIEETPALAAFRAAELERRARESAAEQGGTGDAFSDGDSLFGDDTDSAPVTAPAPPAHPSGLSLPPTPIRSTFPDPAP